MGNIFQHLQKKIPSYNTPVIPRAPSLSPQLKSLYSPCLQFKPYHPLKSTGPQFSPCIGLCSVSRGFHPPACLYFGSCCSHSFPFPLKHSVTCVIVSVALLFLVDHDTQQIFLLFSLYYTSSIKSASESQNVDHVIQIDASPDVRTCAINILLLGLL